VVSTSFTKTHYSSYFEIISLQLKFTSCAVQRSTFVSVKISSDVHGSQMICLNSANVKTLTSEHLPLVRSMAELGSRVLITLGVPHDHQRMGFHIPPFNSIDHLHLHLLGGPFTRFGSIRYLDLGRPGPMGSIKGISWFATPETVCEILSLPNGRVTVGVVRSKPVSLNKKEKARQVEDWTGFASQPLSPTVTIQRRVSGSSNT